MSLEPFTTWLIAYHRKVLAHPEKTQRALLRKILTSSAGSPVAKARNVSGEETFEEFLSLEPQDYTSYSPFVDRVFDGDVHAFGREPIVAFGETSGSSGNPKLIPQTQESLHRVSRFTQTILLFQLFDSKKYLPQFTKWLLITASSAVHQVRGMPVGFISGLMYLGAQSRRKGFILPSPAIAAVTDWEDRIRQIAQEALTSRVGTVFGVPAYLMQFFQESLKQSRGKTLGEIWPLLDTIYYSGTSVNLHRKELEGFFDRKLMIRAFYTATEGSFGAELDKDASGQIRLLPEMAVYTFREVHEPNGRLYGMWELVSGRSYEIFVTLLSGLLQYRIGDVIEVTQTDPLLVRIVGRVGDEINLATEKLSVKQTQAVITHVALTTGINEKRFIVLPDLTNPRRHLWLIEEGASLQIEEVTEKIDSALKSINPSYAALRNGDAVLLQPRIKFVPPHIFDKYISAGFLSRGQFKFRHIFPDTETLIRTPGLETIVLD